METGLTLLDSPPVTSFVFGSAGLAFAVLAAALSSAVRAAPNPWLTDLPARAPMVPPAT